MTILCCHQNNSVHSVVSYVVFWSCVLCYQCCLLLSVELLMCFMIMHRLMQLGFGRHALLEIPLTAPTFFFFLHFLFKPCCLFYLPLAFPNLPTKFVSSASGVQNLELPQTSDLVLYSILSSIWPDQDVSLFLFSCHVAFHWVTPQAYVPKSSSSKSVRVL